MEEDVYICHWTLHRPFAGNARYVSQSPEIHISSHANLPRTLYTSHRQTLTRCTLGYIGRAQLHSNPWNEGAFELQICAIILAPTFICVSIYLTLKHVAINLNPSASRIPPRWYPIIFLPADVSCLIVQAIGGGIAAAGGKTNRKLQESGNRAIIAGVALQVVVLVAFGALSVDYYVRVRRWLARPEAQGTDGWKLWHDGSFKKFRYAISVAFFVILIRCIYRYVLCLSLSSSP